MILKKERNSTFLESQLIDLTLESSHNFDRSNCSVGGACYHC